MKTRLLVDTREQKPLHFKKSAFDEVVREGLPIGDYWMEISEDGVTYHQVPIAFERKGFGDLYGTMTSGYERFRKEMERAKEHGLVLILLIEGSLREVHGGYKHSKFKGESMVKKLGMLRVKYDLEWHCFNDRREMSKYIEEIFGAVARYWGKEKSLPAVCPPKDDGTVTG